MSSNNKNTDKPALTDRDLELLACAMRCVEGGFPKVDYKKFAEMAGFKNANSASVSFGNVKKKLMGEAGSAKSTPKKSGTPKRKQAPASAAGGSDDDDDETPSKKKVKVSSKKPVKNDQDVKVKEEADDDEAAAFL